MAFTLSLATVTFKSITINWNQFSTVDMAFTLSLATVTFKSITINWNQFSTVDTMTLSQKLRLVISFQIEGIYGFHSVTCDSHVQIDYYQLESIQYCGYYDFKSKTSTRHYFSE